LQSSRATSLTTPAAANPIVTNKVRTAIQTLSEYAAFRQAFLNYFVLGKWVNEFLDNNANLVTLHRAAESPSNKLPGLYSGSNPAPRLLMELLQSENDSLVKSPRVLGGLGKEELDVDWIAQFVKPEELLAVFVAAAYPIFLQSKEFNFWLERREGESDADVALKRQVEKDTTQFRLNDEGLEDSADEYDERSVSYHTEVSTGHFIARRRNSNKSTSSHTSTGASSSHGSPHSSHKATGRAVDGKLRFCHRRKSISYQEKLARRADRRRIRLIIQKSLQYLQSPATMMNISGAAPNATVASIDAAAADPDPSQPPVAPFERLERLLREQAWGDSLRSFLDALPLPIVIARAKDPRSMTTLEALARSHETNFSVFYANPAYERLTQSSLAEISGRPFYDVVLAKSTVLSREHGDDFQRRPVSGGHAHGAGAHRYLFGIAERSSAYGAGAADSSQGEDGAFFQAAAAAHGPSDGEEDAAPDTYVQLLLETLRRDGGSFTSALLLKPVHHVVAQPEHHFLVAVQYDLHAPPALAAGAAVAAGGASAAATAAADEAQLPRRPSTSSATAVTSAASSPSFSHLSAAPIAIAIGGAAGGAGLAGSLGAAGSLLSGRLRGDSLASGPASASVSVAASPRLTSPFLPPLTAQPGEAPGGAAGPVAFEAPPATESARLAAFARALPAIEIPEAPAASPPPPTSFSSSSLPSSALSSPQTLQRKSATMLAPGGSLLSAALSAAPATRRSATVVVAASPGGGGGGALLPPLRHHSSASGSYGALAAGSASDKVDGASDKSSTRSVSALLAAAAALSDSSRTSSSLTTRLSSLATTPSGASQPPGGAHFPATLSGSDKAPTAPPPLPLPLPLLKAAFERDLPAIEDVLNLLPQLLY
jgi:PAS domain-containing protein